jgi:2,3-bisphosphoglycerate-independent phosphoglycerate mutase
MAGRYYAMDRDKNWDRVKQAYDAIALGQGQVVDNFVTALETSYANDINDEFVIPQVAQDYKGLGENDGILMINFRADRAREILSALADPEFDAFQRPRPATKITLGMVEYSTQHNAFMPALFPSLKLTNTIGEFIAKAGKKQLRIAETEKYAHVTFFFNGGREETFEGESRILVPSPKVATYDLKPEMSAPEVTDKLVEAIHSGGFDLIVVNFANPDMVGHTGILKAAIKAIETIDISLSRLCQALKETEGVMLVTADHGNVELMQDPDTGGPHTAHTTLDVPLLLIGSEHVDPPLSLSSGRLADIAPTLLTLMGLTPPPEMTGQVLISPIAAKAEAAAVRE